MARAALVLPFSATFALLTWWSGDALRAVALAEKSFLSGMGALLLISTTPLNRLLEAMDSLGAPRSLVLVVQFLYRYLFLISEQAQHMLFAARSRMGRSRRLGFQSAAGSLGVLFARSWEHADGVHRAMLARGFAGRFSLAARRSFGAADAVFLGGAAAASALIRASL